MKLLIKLHRRERELDSYRRATSSISSSGGNGLFATGTGAAVKVGASFIIGDNAAATSGNVSSFGNNEVIDNNPDAVPASAGTPH